MGNPTQGEADFVSGDEGGSSQPGGFDQNGGATQQGGQEQPGAFHQPAGYGQPSFQPGVPNWAGAPGYPMAKTNVLAVIALVCGVAQFVGLFPAGIAAIVVGHIARKQIRQTSEQGDGMALAGLILGYIGLALAVIGIIVIIVLVAHTTQNHVNLPPSRY